MTWVPQNADPEAKADKLLLYWGQRRINGEIRAMGGCSGNSAREGSGAGYWRIKRIAKSGKEGARKLIREV